MMGGERNKSIKKRILLPTKDPKFKESGSKEQRQMKVPRKKRTKSERITVWGAGGIDPFLPQDFV